MPKQSNNQNKNRNKPAWEVAKDRFDEEYNKGTANFEFDREGEEEQEQEEKNKEEVVVERSAFEEEEKPPQKSPKPKTPVKGEEQKKPQIPAPVTLDPLVAAARKQKLEKLMQLHGGQNISLKATTYLKLDIEERRKADQLSVMIRDQRQKYEYAAASSFIKFMLGLQNFTFNQKKIVCFDHNAYEKVPAIDYSNYLKDKQFLFLPEQNYNVFVYCPHMEKAARTKELMKKFMPEHIFKMGNDELYEMLTYKSQQYDRSAAEKRQTKRVEYLKRIVPASLYEDGKEEEQRKFFDSVLMSPHIRYWLPKVGTEDWKFHLTQLTSLIAYNQEANKDDAEEMERIQRCIENQLIYVNEKILPIAQKEIPSDAPDTAPIKSRILFFFGQNQQTAYIVLQLTYLGMVIDYCVYELVSFNRNNDENKFQQQIFFRKLNIKGKLDMEELFASQEVRSLAYQLHMFNYKNRDDYFPKTLGTSIYNAIRRAANALLKDSYDFESLEANIKNRQLAQTQSLNNSMIMPEIQEINTQMFFQRVEEVVKVGEKRAADKDIFDLKEDVDVEMQ